MTNPRTYISRTPRLVIFGVCFALGCAVAALGRYLELYLTAGGLQHSAPLTFLGFAISAAFSFAIGFAVVLILPALMNAALSALDRWEARD